MSTTEEASDKSTDWVTVEIAQRVAAATDRDASELPPLYGAIDTDALETVVESFSGDDSITFSYLDFTVRVSANGTVTLTPEN